MQVKPISMEEVQKTNEQLLEENLALKKEVEKMIKWHKSYESKLKRITLVEETLNRIIETNPLSFEVVDKKGKSKTVNDAFIKIFEEKPGKTYSVFTDAQLIKQGMTPYFDRLKQGEVVYFPDCYYLLHKRNSQLPDKKLWLRVVGFPVFDDKKMPERYGFIHQDITREKLAEGKIKRINKKLQDINKYIVEVREQDRKNFGITIHDEILPYISSLKFRISTIKAIHNEEERSEFVNNLMSDTDIVSEKLKNTVMELVPETPNAMDIKVAIEGFANDFGLINKLYISCNLSNNLDMNYTIALLIFRIMKQALYNVAQHAEADTVEIKLKQNNTCFEFTVTDNGKGITEKDIMAHTSIGIRGMRDRVELMGGTFHIKARQKKGTILQVKLPKIK